MLHTLLFGFSTASMPVNVALLVLGIYIVLKGADWLTDGAVGLASRFGISQFVIGITIVAMGTSMPEFCVSMVSALKGTPDLAVGNVVGSNIFNTLLIVGCSALVAPITVKVTTVKRDMIFAILASVLMLVFCLDGSISRLDAVAFLVLFAIFIRAMLRQAKPSDGEDEPSADSKPLWRQVVFVVLGLSALIAGSNVFVDNASFIASSLGVSDAVIGLTIVAGGTSLPELATSVVSARKGNSDIAIGNVMGSNVFNILMIIGVTGLVQPMHIVGITFTDLLVLVGSALIMWFFCRTKYRVERWEGTVLVVCFLCYLGYLLVQVA